MQLKAEAESLFIFVIEIILVLVLLKLNILVLVLVVKISLLICWDYGYWASVLHDVCVYCQAFAGIHCTYPRRDGQAELYYVADYVLRWFTCMQMVANHPLTSTWPHLNSDGGLEEGEC